MKIDNYGIGRYYEQFAGKKQPGADADIPTKQERVDRVEISSQAAEMNRAQALAQKGIADDSLRQGRVAHIKSLIEAGRYHVSSKAVANSIVKGTAFDRKV